MALQSTLAATLLGAPYVAGDSAWKRMTSEDFKGKAIPFGAKVFFKPTDTRDKTYAGKFDPKGISGVFAGYVITTGQQWSRKYKVWDMAEFAGVNLSMDAAVPRKLAQPYLTEVVVLPEDLVFPLKDEYERMNSTLEGLNDNTRLQGREIKDADDVDRPPSGGDDDDDDDDDDSKKKPPPDPDEIDDGAGAGGIPLDDYYTAVDAMGEKILERDEIDARAHRAPPPSSTSGRVDGPIEPDDIGPSGRLIPKGGEEDPGEILRRLKDAAGALFAFNLDWILREGVWHHMEDRAVILDSPVKFDRYVERAVFQFHPVRPSLVATPVVEDLVQTTLPYPYGRRYVRTLLPEWRSVVAALARAIHGGFQGFTLPLRFNGRPHRDRIPYMGSFFWTKIIEEVWEDMSQKMRELEGYGHAIVPHVTEFQDCNDGLVIEFYDGTKELVHTYKDEGNKLRVRIKILDTPRAVAIWTLVGVDEDNWWQQYAPGLGDAMDFAPEQHYVPQTRMNILCTGRQVDDAMCDYLADVFRNKQKESENAAVFVGAGVLGGTSWIDKNVMKSSQNINFRTEYHWGEVVQRIALAAAKSGTQVIIEVPPEAQVADTKQYRLLSNKELWRHNVMDGCSHGQRLLVRDHENQPCVKYCNKKWEFFSANTAREHKPSDACKAKHNHACEQDYSDLSGR